MLKKIYPHRPAISIDTEEGLALDIEQELRASRLPPPPALLPGAPVEIHDVGRLTAEAMKKEYESAAESIETLGHELMAIKARLDKEQAAILDAIDEVIELTKRWRERGERMAATVEDCAKQTQRVRDICRDLEPKE